MSVVVVGVDDSDGAKAALRFALDEARMRDATLRVVHVWEFPGYVGLLGFEGSYPGFAGDIARLREAAEMALRATLADFAAEMSNITVDARVSEGSPAIVLVDESRGADLLVVGSRGRGGFASLLLGSVSQQCAQHASCPVVIVHRTDEP